MVVVDRYGRVRQMRGRTASLPDRGQEVEDWYTGGLAASHTDSAGDGDHLEPLESLQPRNKGRRDRDVEEATVRAGAAREDIRLAGAEIPSQLVRPLHCDELDIPPHHRSPVLLRRGAHIRTTEREA